MSILITGCAGFIGFHLVKSLCKIKSNNIYGIDNLNSYYDIDLKKNRLKELKSFKNFNFYKIDLNNKIRILNLCKKYKIKYIINLAAQAGVRYSINNPKAYFDSNIKGFYNILEISKLLKINHLIIASTSSVYGNLKSFPLTEDMNTDKPLSFYAATKKSNEVMAYAYSNIYKIPTTGLRFFTVYGPYGRPDMSLFKFTQSIIEGKKIYLYNNGNHIRDFTYVDTIINSIIKIIKKPPKKTIPYDIYNLGSGLPIPLKKFLRTIEKNLNKKSQIIKKDLQIGDVVKTHANVKKIINKTKNKDIVSLDSGIKHFIDWYNQYYKN